MAPTSASRRSFQRIDLSPMLRALGLDIVTSFVRSKIHNRNAPEPTKKVLDGSKWHAISRNTIHFLPMSVLIFLIAINYSTFYIGPTFVEDPNDNGLFIAGIQICAKLQELLCVASLTVIVLHALRHELLGPGVPIGILGSGIWFTSLASFWSPAFLGSFAWTRPSWRKFRSFCRNPFWNFPWSKLRFYILLVTCGLIAVTIGPASAVLMTPREQSFPAGGASFLLYGAKDLYFPSTVTSASEPEICASTNATSYAVCPAAGFESLSLTLSRFSYRALEGFDAQRYFPDKQARGAEGNRAWDNFLIQSPGNRLPPVLNGVRSRYWSDFFTTAIQPHAATVAFMQSLRYQWYEGARERSRPSVGQFKWSYDLKTLGSATSPWVKTKCGIPRNITADDEMVLFPSLQRTGNHSIDWAIGADEYRNASIADLQRNRSSQIRTQWLPLPITDFGVQGTDYNLTGVLVELPWVGDSRAVMPCSISAAWHNGTVRSERSTSYSAWSIALTPFDYTEHNDASSYEKTNTPVTLDQSWLQLLTPVVPGRESDSPSLNTLETILDRAGVTQIPSVIRAAPMTQFPVCDAKLRDQNATDISIWRQTGNCAAVGSYFVEQVVAMMVVDGLSRFSSWRVTNMTSVDPQTWSTLPVPSYNRSQMLLTSRYKQNADLSLTKADSTGAWLAVFVSGFAYYPSNSSDKLSLVPVAGYLLLVSLYILYTIYWITIRRRHGTSSSWDSVTELLVLCQNSPPPDPNSSLKNTSAGIEHFKTYRSVVKVRAFPPANGEGDPTLRLVLDENSLKGSSYVDSGSSRSSSPTQKPGQPDVSNVFLNDVTTTAYMPRRPESTFPRNESQRVRMDSKYG